MRQRLIDALRGRLAEPGTRAVPAAVLFDWQRGDEGYAAEAAVGSMEPALADRLRPDHPDLRDLRRRYRDCDPAVTRALVWDDGTVGAEDLRAFRGETAHVWQRRGASRSINAYALAAYHLFALSA